MNTPRILGAVTQAPARGAESGFVGAPAALVPFVRLGRVSVGLLLLILLRTAVATEANYEIAFGASDGTGGCLKPSLFGPPTSHYELFEPGTDGRIRDSTFPDLIILGHGKGWARRGDLFLSTSITGPFTHQQCAQLSARAHFDVDDLKFTSWSGNPVPMPKVSFNYKVLKHLQVEEMSDVGNQGWVIKGGLATKIPTGGLNPISAVTCGGCDLVPGNNRDFDDDLFPNPLSNPPQTVDVTLDTLYSFFMDLETGIQVYQTNAPLHLPINAQAHLLVDCREPVFNLSSNDISVDSVRANIVRNRFEFPTPTISSITPDEGAAGTIVTISGSGLEGVTKVSFRELPENSGVEEASFQYDSDGKLRATVPTMGTGARSLRVTVEAACDRVAEADLPNFFHESRLITISPLGNTAEGSAHEFLVRISPLLNELGEEEPVSVYVATSAGTRLVCTFPPSSPFLLRCDWIAGATPGTFCQPYFDTGSILGSFGTGTDFVSYNATLGNFIPGANNNFNQDANSNDGIRSVIVHVCGDGWVEEDEAFFVQMSQPTGGEFSYRSGRASATGTIKSEEIFLYPLHSLAWPP